MAVPSHSIELSATGLKLAFGPPVGGTSISLDAMGVSAQSGLTNQIQLAEQGLTVRAIKVNSGPDRHAGAGGAADGNGRHRLPNGRHDHHDVNRFHHPADERP